MTAKKININKRYEITLTKSEKVGRTWLRPGTKTIVSGAVLKDIQDKVSDYREV